MVSQLVYIVVYLLTYSLSPYWIDFPQNIQIWSTILYKKADYHMTGISQPRMCTIYFPHI